MVNKFLASIQSKEVAEDLHVTPQDEDEDDDGDVHLLLGGAGADVTPPDPEPESCLDARGRLGALKH